nr:hypothetical protein [Mycoplasmopsis bovis]
MARFERKSNIPWRFWVLERLLKVSQTINGLRLVEGNVPVVRFLPR